MKISRNVVILAAVLCLLVVAVLATMRTRVPQAPAMTPTATIAPPATPAPVVAPAAPAGASGAPASTAPADDATLAKESPDPLFVNFLDNFKSSGVGACKTAMAGSLRTTDQAVLQRIDDICTCAMGRVADTITLGEARSAMSGALTGHSEASPAMAALKSRSEDAGKACAAEKMGHPTAP